MERVRGTQLSWKRFRQYRVWVFASTFTLVPIGLLIIIALPNLVGEMLWFIVGLNWVLSILQFIKSKCPRCR